ncbi:MAG TPA: FAD-dependent oxidoreductase [Thermoanaerobaculia bacterium]|jgi:NADPH-dependent 2,4-dienoyl-CoA reductase/sulfur reductase-like enzyme
MPETIAFTCDGRAVSAPAGITLAAALEGVGGGRAPLRRSVIGEPRGVLCAMGVCYECRVTVDGRPHRRACLEIVREGMDVRTGEESVSCQLSAVSSEREALECDVAVVGGGPAGVAAACRAAEAGARTVLLDEGAAPGGQIHRHLPGREAPPAARAWLARLAQSGAEVRARVSVFDAVRVDAGEAWRLLAEGAEAVLAVTARAIVLATGSRELFLPFPGWTLPGVYGAGGAQALWKSGASLAGRTAIVGGSGPLLLPVAASLAKAGARVAGVVEQAGVSSLAGFAIRLGRSPSRIREAVRYRRGFAGTPYRTGTWIAEARGSGRLEGVVLADARGRGREIACDLAAIGWGLTPNTELARLLGCRITEGRVAVDERQETGVPGVFCAGEACGVAGVEAAIAEGQIAGGAASAAPRRLDPKAGWEKEPWDWRRLTRARAAARSFAGAMQRAFRLRPELARLAREDTLVCRCEDVALRPLRACNGMREAKLAARAGMGPCQGRVCGPALAFLFGWDSDTVRTPIQPAALGALGVAPAGRASEEEGLG